MPATTSTTSAIGAQPAGRIWLPAPVAALLGWEELPVPLVVGNVCLTAVVEAVAGGPCVIELNALAGHSLATPTEMVLGGAVALTNGVAASVSTVFRNQPGGGGARVVS
jgi:hypothetical protein